MSWTHDRARLAALSRSRPEGDPELEELRQRITAERERIASLGTVERLADHITKTLERVRPLTEEETDLLIKAVRGEA